MRKLADVLKSKRFIGLVLLTIFVIVGIVLTVFLVEKNSTIYKLDIKQLGQTKECSFCVDDIKTNNLGEYVELEVYITIQANKYMRLNENDFIVNGNKPKEAVNFKNKLKASEKVEFILKYDIYNNELLFLTFDSFQVALASVM